MPINKWIICPVRHRQTRENQAIQAGYDMKLNVAENARRNMLWGTVQRTYQILVPFLLRSVFIRRLGIEYVGLSGLFSSLLSFLNLAELGVGSAVLYFLYRPVAENDQEAVRQLLGLIRDAYRRIGLLIFGLGLVLTPFLRLLVSEELPPGVNLYTIYLLNLLQSVLPYWLFAEKPVVLEVHQRNDMANRIYLATLSLRYALQFIILFLLPDYYLYLLAVILTQVLERFLLALAVDRRYPAYRTVLPAPPMLQKEVSHKAGGLLFHKLGGVIVNSADALVITAFLGLAVLGKYQNYLQIMTAVLGIVNLINSSWGAGIGNIIAREGPGAAYRSFEHATFLVFFTSTVCCCCFLNLYQPFIALWAGPDLLLDDGLIVLLCMYFYSLRLMAPGNLFESAGGLWRQDKLRPLAEGLCNLGLNLILVRYTGLYGILLSTILSMVLLSVPWLYHIVVGTLFQKSTAAHLRRLLLYMAASAAICAASRFVCRSLPDMDSLLMVLFVRAIVSVSVPLALLWLLCRKWEAWNWMTRHTARLFHLPL